MYQLRFGARCCASLAGCNSSHTEPAERALHGRSFQVTPDFGLETWQDAGPSTRCCHSMELGISIWPITVKICQHATPRLMYRPLRNTISGLPSETLEPTEQSPAQCGSGYPARRTMSDTTLHSVWRTDERKFLAGTHTVLHETTIFINAPCRSQRLRVCQCSARASAAGDRVGGGGETATADPCRMVEIGSGRRKCPTVTKIGHGDGDASESKFYEEMSRRCPLRNTATKGPVRCHAVSQKLRV